MAVKASATITLSFMVDIQAVYRYYKLQSSTAATPTAPTTNPPNGWTDAEPSYTSGSTNTLYFVDLTVFTNDTFSYSPVSKSSSYEAAKEAYNKAVAAGNAVNDLEIGGRNLIINSDFDGVAFKYNHNNASGEGGLQIWTDKGNVLMSQFLQPTDKYTISLRMRGYANIVLYMIGNPSGNSPIAWITSSDLSETDYKEFALTFTPHKELQSIYIYTRYRSTAYTEWFEIQPNSLKLEIGNKKTDWTPAPEDVRSDITESVESLNTTVSARLDMIGGDIETLSNRLQNLIVDENGSSLIDVTGDSWTFAMGDYVGKVRSELLQALENSDTLTDEEISKIKDELIGLSELKPYVRINRSGTVPVIELGNDSAFKVRITNTSIDFLNGETRMAYITNESLKIKRAEIEDELIIGGFAWKERANGNMGLIWKG